MFAQALYDASSLRKSKRILEALRRSLDEETRPHMDGRAAMLRKKGAKRALINHAKAAKPEVLPLVNLATSPPLQPCCVEGSQMDDDLMKRNERQTCSFN